MEHNYNPGENSKQSCGKSEISKVDGDKYNLVFNTTWKYRGKTTSKPYKQCKMSVAACIEAASYWSRFRPCCKSASPQMSGTLLFHCPGSPHSTWVVVFPALFIHFFVKIRQDSGYFSSIKLSFDVLIHVPNFQKNRANRPRQLRSYGRNG